MSRTAPWLRLVEEETHNLAERIGKYTTGLHGKLSRVTAHQLMSHTAGIRDEAPAFGAHDETALAATVRSWGDDYLFTEPGRVMSYSNPGLTLAGFVVEQVAKSPYA